MQNQLELCDLVQTQFKNTGMLIPVLFYRVFFRGVTWQRDSHGLFDYESRNISKKNLKTQYTGKIVR